MARFDRQVVALDHVRVLVGLHADAVAGAVDEPLPEAGVGDDLARGPVDVLARRTHHPGGHTGGLRRVEHGVRLGHLGGWFAERDAAGDVAAVAVLGATEVAQHELAGADHPIRRVVVRRGRVLPRGDDGEVDDVVPLGEQPSALIAANSVLLGNIQVVGTHDVPA